MFQRAGYGVQQLAIGLLHKTEASTALENNLSIYLKDQHL